MYPSKAFSTKQSLILRSAKKKEKKNILLLKCYHAKPEFAKKTHTGSVWTQIGYMDQMDGGTLCVKEHAPIFT